MNHKWDKNNVCVNCGVKRKRQTWKLLMAITNHPPYDHYKYGTSWTYTFENNFRDNMWTFKRPDCKQP